LASKEAGLGKIMAMKRFDTLSENFENALKEAALEMYDLGFKDAKSLGNDILKLTIGTGAMAPVRP